jgi:hypothetical protein
VGKASVRDWLVAVQVNALSLIDEGVDPVLDRFQNEALADTVMLAVHGFNPEVIDQPEDFSGHGRKRPLRTAGGSFFMPNPEYYAGVPLGGARVREAAFEGFDALAETGRAAKARGMSLYLYILESASTGGRQRNIPGWTRILEIDVKGRRSALPCVNNPTYRAWKHALMEDLYKSYEFQGMLWGVERWGPLHVALAGGCACCFCPHCRAIARDRGLDWKGCVEGFGALCDAVSAWRAGAPASGAQTPFVELLRILLAHPEILAWERLWTDRYMALHRELYGVAKWLKPERAFGLGLWHYYFISPLLRAEWDMKEFARSADFIRPILYHFPEGTRLLLFLRSLGAGAFASFADDTLMQAVGEALGLRLPPQGEVAKRGLPADFVRQCVENVRRDVGDGKRIYPGIGIDVRQHGLKRRMRPADVIQAVEAAAAAGADGITASRNYGEMRIANLRAFGQALKRLGR